MVRSYVLPLLTWAAASFLGAYVDASPLPLYGINYNTRNGPDWAPAEEKCKSPEEIAADLKAISNITSRIRIYSLTDCNQGKLVLEAAKAYELQVELGLWVSADEAVFKAERARLVDLVTSSGLVTKDLVTAIHVGSEAVYRKEVTSKQIIDYMKDIKAVTKGHALNIPVTIADIGDVYLAHPELVDAVDFVSANGFPFWERKPVMGAAAYFQSRMQPLMDMAAKQNKEFVISETGWASDGVNVNASIASPGNAAQYLKDFLALATNWKFYYFEAFDEPWKLALDKENTVEGYFGIFHANRTLKSDFAALGLSAPVVLPPGGQHTGPSGPANGGNNGTPTTGNNGGNTGATGTGNSGATGAGNKGSKSESGIDGTTGTSNSDAKQESGNAGTTGAGNNGAKPESSATSPHPDCPV